MTTATRAETPLIVPRRLQQKAGIQEGDRLKFDVTRHTKTIAVMREPSCRPTKTELAAIRKREAAIARREYVALMDLLDDIERRRRAAAKRARKIPR